MTITKAAAEAEEQEQDSEDPIEPSTLPSPPSFRFDPNNASSQNLLSRAGSGYESQYGSLFGSRFSLTDGTGTFIPALALTIILSAIIIVGIVLITVIITLAVMLSSCNNRSTVALQLQGFSDFCYSFRLNIELNNDRTWVLPSVCDSYINDYIGGEQYQQDVEVAVESAQRYLKSLPLDNLENYAVVFDIDETALSNALYYKKLDFRFEGFMSYAWSTWMNQSSVPPLAPVLRLYQQLHAANWSIFFISERPQSLYDATVKNLVDAGYEGWTSLILRPLDDDEITVQTYKSKRRLEIEKQGYHVVTVLGDQWSDIVGPAAGSRTFKLPNPVYQIC